MIFNWRRIPAHLYYLFERRQTRSKYLPAALRILWFWVICWQRQGEREKSEESKATVLVVCGWLKRQYAFSIVSIQFMKQWQFRYALHGAHCTYELLPLGISSMAVYNHWNACGLFDSRHHECRSFLSTFCVIVSAVDSIGSISISTAPKKWQDTATAQSITHFIN